MFLFQTKPAVVNPISLAQFKDHLRVTSDAQDDYIQQVLSVSLSEVQRLCGVAFVAQSWELRLSEFPIVNSGFSSASYAPIRLEKTPLIKVDSVQYKDLNGVLQTWSASLYQISEMKDRVEIEPSYQESYPQIRGDRDSVIVKFRAGWLSLITADASTNVVNHTNHPFTADDVVYFSYRDDDGSLPGGLALLTPYYVVNPVTNTFQVSATSGGSVIDITSAGSGTLFVFREQIPVQLLQAVKVLGAHLYENRQNTIAGTIIANVPGLFDLLVAEYRGWSF